MLELCCGFRLPVSHDSSRPGESVRPSEAEEALSNVTMASCVVRVCVQKILKKSSDPITVTAVLRKDTRHRVWK